MRLLRMTPDQLRPFLKAHRRVRARQAFHDARVAGLYQLTPASRRQVEKSWEAAATAYEASTEPAQLTTWQKTWLKTFRKKETA